MERNRAAVEYDIGQDGVAATGEEGWEDAPESAAQGLRRTCCCPMLEFVRYIERTFQKREVQKRSRDTIRRTYGWGGVVGLTFERLS